MKPSWNTLTVGQFLDIYRLSIDKSLDDMSKVERAICILYDITERQLDDLTVLQFTAYAKEAAQFITDKIPGKPVKSMRVGKHRYAITYDPTKLRHRQYVEVVTFGEKPVENMHLIMASVVQPVNWLGFRKRNNAEDHLKIADDMLKARVVDVYHSCVFFCKLYMNLIENIRDFLVNELTTKGMKKNQAEETIQISINIMAGFTQQEKLQSMSE